MRGEIVLLIIAMGIVTYLTRFASFALLRNVTISARAVKTLRFIPVAVLSALVVPEVVMPQGTLFLSYKNPYILAGLCTLLVAYKSKNMVLSIVTGLFAMFILRQFFGL